jgi:hypothetical protein
MVDMYLDGKMPKALHQHHRNHRHIKWIPVFQNVLISPADLGLLPSRVSNDEEVYDDPNSQEGLTSNMMAYFVQAEAGATGTQTAIASRSETWVAQILPIVGELEEHIRYDWENNDCLQVGKIKMILVK